MNNVIIPVSVGELIDKITILEIKQEKIHDTNKLANVSKELLLLKSIFHNVTQEEIKPLIVELKNINLLLWDIEDKKRLKEKEKSFDREFIELARAVYIYNDKRAEIKRQINFITNSNIIEEKSYD